MSGISALEQYIIDKVRELRKEKNISQTTLAHLMDFSEGFVADIESTKRRAKWNLDHINKLAIILECSPKDFLPDKPFEE